MCVSLFDWKTVDFIVDKVFYIALGENVVWTDSDDFFQVEVKKEKEQKLESSLGVFNFKCVTGRVCSFFAI